MSDIQISQKFGRLTVVELGFVDSRRNRQAICLCECGRKSKVHLSSLRNGHSTSCGCLRKDRARAACTTHGMYRSKEYESWKHMKARCNDSSRRDYHGRGIRVCERWNSFANFIADMGPKPTPKHEIDRIDNGGNYEPDNCRWATRIEQQRNKRSNRIITIDGVSLLAIEWAEKQGMKSSTLNNRLANGWNERDAVLKPVNHNLARR